jgi:hypothetical protein
MSSSRSPLLILPFFLAQILVVVYVVLVIEEGLVEIKRNLGKEDVCAAVANLTNYNIAVMKGGAYFTKSLKATSVKVGQTTLNLN